MTRTIFMGTPDFAVPSLRSLISAGYEVVAVVTQPDRQRGRGKHMLPPPVKVAAVEAGIPVHQPNRVRGRAFRRWLSEQNPELIVVTAYGKILPKRVLEFPRFGCINVHASLLPAYRGAAPIQWALINGETTSGVTIMKMDEGMDTGPMLAVREMEIDPGDTAGDLHDKLAQLGAELLAEILPHWLAGEITPRAQDDALASMAAMLSKSDGRIDWNRSAGRVNDHIRGVTPWPAAWTTLGGVYLKLFPGQVLGDHPKQAPAGTILQSDSTLVVQCGEGALELDEVQLQGRRRMACSSFLRGHPISAGTVLGDTTNGTSDG